MLPDAYATLQDLSRRHVRLETIAVHLPAIPSMQAESWESETAESRPPMA